MGCFSLALIAVPIYAWLEFYDFSVSGISSVFKLMVGGHSLSYRSVDPFTALLFAIGLPCLLLYQLTSGFALAYTLKKVEFLNSCLKPEYRYTEKISTLFNITIITAFVSLLVEFVDLLIFDLLGLGLVVAMCVIGIKSWKKNIKTWESVEVLKKMAKTYYYYFIAIPILGVLSLCLLFTVSITAYVIIYALELLLDLFLFAFLYDCMKVVIQQYDKEVRMQEIEQEDEEKQEEDNEEKEDENKEEEEEFINQESKNKCPNCNAEIPDDAKFCPECGYKIDSKINCPKCGTELQENEIFCPECGFHVRQERN